ncbi:hypothetical protein D3C77_473970 [compost metagenome]
MCSEKVCVPDIFIVAASINQRRCSLHFKVGRRIHNIGHTVVLLVIRRICHELWICCNSMRIARLQGRSPSTRFVESIIRKYGLIECMIFSIPFGRCIFRGIVKYIVEEINRILEYFIVEPVHLLCIIHKYVI